LTTLQLQGSPDAFYITVSIHAWRVLAFDPRNEGSVGRDQRSKISLGVLIALRNPLEDLIDFFGDALEFIIVERTLFRMKDGPRTSRNEAFAIAIWTADNNLPVHVPHTTNSIHLLLLSIRDSI
jgi:hypothetical protein